MNSQCEHMLRCIPNIIMTELHLFSEARRHHKAKVVGREK